jgi:hypothetical protein
LRAFWQLDLEDLDQRLADIGKRHPPPIKWLNRLTHFELPAQSAVRIAIGVACLAFMAVYVVRYLLPYGPWFLGRPTLASLVLGIALLSGARVLKRADEEAAPALPNAPVLTVWDEQLNLAYVLVLVVLLMVCERYWVRLTEARLLSVIALVVSFLLRHTSARLLAALSGVATFALLPVVWMDPGFNARMDALFFTSTHYNLLTYFLGPILATALVLSVLPVLRLIRIGELGIGRIKGDVRLRLYGVPIYLPVGSALLLTCAGQLAYRLLSVEQWFS